MATNSGAKIPGSGNSLAVIAQLNSTSGGATARRDVILANAQAFPAVVASSLADHKSGARTTLLDAIGEIASDAHDLAQVLEAAGAEAPALVEALLFEGGRVLLESQKPGAQLNEEVAANALETLVAVAGLSNAELVEEILRQVNPFVFAATFYLMGVRIPEAVGLSVDSSVTLTPDELMSGMHMREDGDDEAADAYAGTVEGRDDRSTVTEALSAIHEWDENLYRRILLCVQALQRRNLRVEDVFTARVDEYRGAVAAAVEKQTKGDLQARAQAAIASASAGGGEKPDWQKALEEEGDVDAEGGFTEVPADSVARPAKKKGGFNID